MATGQAIRLDASVNLVSEKQSVDQPESGPITPPDSSSAIGLVAPPGTVASKTSEVPESVEVVFQELRDEIGSVQRRSEELAARCATAEVQTAGLETRLTDFREFAKTATDRADRIEERLAAIERNGADTANLGVEVDHLRDQQRSGRVEDNQQRAILQAAIDTVQGETASIRQAMEDHVQSQAGWNEALARLESSRLEHETQFLSLRETAESSDHRILEQLQTLQEQVQQAIGEQLALRRQLETTQERLQDLQAENAAYQESLEGLRREARGLGNPAMEAVESVRSELILIRREIEALAATARPGKPLAAEPGSVGKDDEVPFASLVVDLTNLSPDPVERQHAHDLAVDRFFGSDPVTENDGSIEDAGTSADDLELAGEDVTSPDLPSSAVQAEYLRFASLIDQMMKETDHGEAIVIARQLVSFAREKFGDLSVEYAIWLRNLAMMLLRQGNRDEARQGLLQARAVGKVIVESSPTPYAVCSIDLAQLSLADGNGGEAQSLCREAFEILREKFGPDHSLTKRAEASLARIESNNLTRSVVVTV